MVPLSVRTNQGTVNKSAYTPNKLPHLFSCGSAASRPQRGPVRWLTPKLPQIILSSFLTSHLSLHWAGQTPPPLSHIFHWKTKWYSMLPIASPFVSFLHPCVLSVLLKDLKGVVELRGYLGTRDWQVEILAWLSHDLTDSRLHLGHLVRQRLDFTGSGRNHTEWNPRTQTFWKSFPIWWGNMTPVACWNN